LFSYDSVRNWIESQATGGQDPETVSREEEPAEAAAA
jgi:hypothetical protein